MEKLLSIIVNDSPKEPEVRRKRTLYEASFNWKLFNDIYISFCFEYRNIYDYL